VLAKERLGCIAAMRLAMARKRGAMEVVPDCPIRRVGIRTLMAIVSVPVAAALSVDAVAGRSAWKFSKRRGGRAD
jgi:hypothetical protein